MFKMRPKTTFVLIQNWNERKTSLKWNQESRRGSTHTVPHEIHYQKHGQLQEAWSVTDTQQKNHQLQATTGKVVHCIYYKKWIPQQLNQWEAFISLNSHFSPKNFPSEQPLPTSSFFSIKWCFFFCWACLWLLPQFACPKLQLFAVLEKNPHFCR